MADVGVRAALSTDIRNLTDMGFLPVVVDGVIRYFAIRSLSPRIEDHISLPMLKHSSTVSC